MPKDSDVLKSGVAAVPSSSKQLRPPLRWAGSKKRQISKLLRLISGKPEKVIEPFAGSACFTLQLNASRSTISDLNTDLIHFYRALKEDPEDLHVRFSALEVSESNYYQVRSRFNKNPSGEDKSALFLYLNRYGFNGIYRVNKSGLYNVPWGGEKSGAPPSLADLIAVSERMKTISVCDGDFEEVVRRELAPGALVYLDPPYARDEVRVFREYHANSFSTSDWERLVALIYDIDRIGAYFVLSYAGDSELVDALRRWEVGRLEVTRNVGGFASTRRKHSEFMASNYTS
ncbi:Dam family site-specific DNA-(adenine-N6)-methyltransferase [Sagittula marina]|uniref:Dam family site-specific DNA-(adenine-N6)-methyltransferase n=1 Tax=Sagittula marina TaxID=943940 RepID=UPI00161A46A0